jgi:hypothetical protein
MKKLFARGAQWNWALLDQALVSGTNFLMGVLLVRYLGFEQYGLFVLAWMAVQFVMGVQNALIVSPMMSIAPKLSGTRRSGYYAAALRLQTLLIALAALLVAALSLIPTVYRPQWLADGATLPLVSCMVFLQLQDFFAAQSFLAACTAAGVLCRPDCLRRTTAINAHGGGSVSVIPGGPIEYRRGHAGVDPGGRTLAASG